MLIFHPGHRARRAALGAAAALCCASFSTPTVLAQMPVQVADAGTVVVTATRTPQPMSRVIADISVLERDAIERSGASCVADLLVRLPGVAMARSGGPGGTTSVFIRGADNRHTAVYIDGLRVDSQSTGGAPWELLPIDQIERIEVLRGPAAAVYGSDAIGGVVQVFTKRGRGQLQAGAGLSVGSYATVLGQASLSGTVAGADLSLSVSDGRSDGFNARTTATANPDKDGWRRSSLLGSVGLQLAPGHRLEAGVSASNLRSQYDGFDRAADDVSRQALRTLNATWQGDWSADSNTRVQVGQTEATYETRPSFYRTETTLRNYVLQQGQKLGDHQFNLVLERREDELLNPATAFADTLRGRRTQDALGLGWQMSAGAHDFQAFVRHDHDSEFGNTPTGSLGWGWQVQPNWRVTASAATSFRAPTLYQRFSEYGVRNLVPEKGRNVELGLRWAAGGHEASLTTWNNHIRNLITYTSAGSCQSRIDDPEFGGCYQNVGKTRLQGVTLAGRTRLAGVSLRGSLDYHDPRNLDLDKLLQRRARVLGTFGADGQWGGWGLGMELQASGARYDDAANTAARRMGGYGLVNLRADRSLAQGLVLEARIDNLGDKAYETARTYAQAGRTVQVGLRWALR